MISPAEMRVLDRNAQHFGVSILELMENAGKAVADVARSEFGAAGKNVLVLCGTGNNGGDGLVAARHLTKDARVTVLLARSPDQFVTQESATNFERLRDVQILAGLDKSEEAIADADLLIDALLGIGAEGPLREPYAAMIGPGEFTLYPVPKATSHKGQNGRVLVIAGGPYTGAPALVGYGALGVGADLIHVATPALAASVVASYSPMFIVHPLVGHRLLREDTRQIVDLASRADAIAIGPGLGDAEGTLDAVKEIVRSVSLPLVVDADAVRAVASDPKCLVGKRAVITPHSREFQTLTGKVLPDAPEERAEIVREAAKAFGATILLKGHVDIVTDGTRVKFNYTGNPGMTVGGTGDVLCGVVTGLMSKGMSPFDAARLGAFANGYAGDLAFKVKSYGLTSVDVAENLGRVLAEFL